MTIPYLIKDETVLQELRHLAKVRGKSLADVLREAMQHEMERENARTSTMEKLAPIHARIRAIGKPAGRIDWDAEKRASDELWGE